MVKHVLLTELSGDKATSLLWNTRTRPSPLYAFTRARSGSGLKHSERKYIQRHELTNRGLNQVAEQQSILADGTDSPSWNWWPCRLHSQNAEGCRGTWSSPTWLGLRKMMASLTQKNGLHHAQLKLDIYIYIPPHRHCQRDVAADPSKGWRRALPMAVAAGKLTL
jgi:hypothetical protein